METPEPRRRRGSGADDGTPQPIISEGATPAPTALLRRRGHGESTNGATLHGAILASGPSVLLDEESTTAIAISGSPQPSQLTPQYPPGQSPLPRQRPRFHTVQDLDVALNQAIEGKITSRNAWASKEASDLLEGITHTIETTLDAAATDDYAGFAKAATVVEGCSKVWTSRVDSTYQQSSQMVQRLLRHDDATGGQPSDGADGEEAEDGVGVSQRPKSRSRSSANGTTAAARTLAIDATEINLDSKGRTALTQSGMHAQFRAVTSKFDQGNAQGLLMHNAPMGRAGNIVLDVDYSVMPDSTVSATASRRASGIAAASEAEGEALPTGAPVLPSRASQHLAVELDAAVYETVEDLPNYAGLSVAALDSLISPTTHHPQSARSSQPFPPPRESTASATRGSQSSAIDPLLLLPHASPPATAATDLSRVSLQSEMWERRSGMQREGGEGSGPHIGSEGLTSLPEGAQQPSWQPDGDEEIGGDYGDWAEAGDGDDSSAHNDATDAGAGAGAGAVANSFEDSGVDRGAEARRLVTGVAEMEMMDTLFQGGTQLALEAEDPTSWCPLSEVSANPLAGVQGCSALARLHREHRFASSQKGLAGDDVARGMQEGDSFGSPPQSPVTKRSRKERTVVFQLPESGAEGRGGKASTAPGLVTNSELLLQEEGMLRQASTKGRSITPLGKQLLLAKDAAHAVLAYTQGVYQRTKAEQAGLVLPEAPIPGKTIPSYMPFPVHTQSFFQPFSTALTHWNLLRKSALGHLVENISGGNEVEGPSPSLLPGSVTNSNYRSSHAAGAMACEDGVNSRRANPATITAEEEEEEEDARAGLANGGPFIGQDDMPVEFFPGGAEVEGSDGGEAGYDGDYADYAELYGPDDNGDRSDEDRENRYVQEGFRSSADARLVAQMDAAAAAVTAAIASSSIAGSSHASTRSSAKSDSAFMDPMELVKVLSPPEATMPSQVDVVKLRQLMWEALQGHLIANAQEEAADLTTLRAGAVTAASAQSGGAASSSSASRPAVKAHTQAVLARLRTRARAAAEKVEADESAGFTRGTSDKAPSSAGKSPTTTTGSAAATEMEEEVALITKFSDVVRTVLPHVPSVSSTNTLSPAFFFFSILFLANEHNVVLQSVESLDDLRACGIARRVGE